MPNRRREAKFKYCQIPDGADLLAVLGSAGIKTYGLDEVRRTVLPNHFHNLLEIGICRRGRGTVVFNNDRRFYTENSVIIIPTNFPHNIINAEGEKSFWEFIYVDTMEFLLSAKFRKRDAQRFQNRIESGPIKRQKEEVPLLVRELDCLMDQIRIQDYGYRNCVKGLLFTVLMEIVKINSDEFVNEKRQDTMEYVNDDKSGKLQLALSFVEEHFAEDIKISDIAEATFISESYLRRLFSEKYNMTPVQYVNYIRIQEACKLLKNKKFNISEAAQKVGFNNMSTFITNFRKVKNQTPGQWIKNMHKSIEENTYKQ